MARELRRVAYEELEANLTSIFEHLLAKNEAIVVEREGRELALIKPLRPTRTRRSRKPGAPEVARSREGIIKAAGGWKGIVDAEAFKAYIRERRRSSSRPPANL